MRVTVELFGIPRARAGAAQTTAVGHCLGDVLADLAKRFPALAEACIEERNLRPGFTTNLGGQRFVTSRETSPHEDDTVMLFNHM